MHFVYVINDTAVDLVVDVKLKLWGVLPRVLTLTVSSQSGAFVPQEAQTRPFSITISSQLHRAIYEMDVEGFSELTVSMATSGKDKTAVEEGDDEFTVKKRTQSFMELIQNDRSCNNCKQPVAADGENCYTDEEAALAQMMQMQNCYDILQVDRTADDRTIRRAYYRLAQRFHPDKNGGSLHSTIIFRKLTEAYTMLRDPTTREKYNRYLDFRSGIFSKDFWKLLAKDKSRVVIFASSIGVLVAGIVGLTLSGGIALPLVAVTTGCACGALVGTGLGLAKYSLSLKAALDGGPKDVRDIVRAVAAPSFAGCIAGGLTVGVGSLIVAGLQSLSIAATYPTLVSLVGVSSEYAIYQATAVSIEGAVSDRWVGCGVGQVVADLGFNTAIAMAVGGSIGYVADIASLMIVDEVPFATLTSTEAFVEAVGGATAEGILITVDVPDSANGNGNSESQNSTTNTEARPRQSNNAFNKKVLVAMWIETERQNRHWNARNKLFDQNRSTFRPMLEFSSVADYKAKTKNANRFTSI